MAAAGFGNIEKVEGITVVDKNTIAVLNDNDFGVHNPFSIKTPEQRDLSKKSYLFFFSMEQSLTPR